MDSSLSIGYLADHPEWVEELVNQHWEEWRDLVSTSGSSSKSLKSFGNIRKIDKVYQRQSLLFDEDLLLGSVSLEVYDYQQIQQYSPWLTSLWVMPFARHRGLGTYLVRRMVHEAACLKIPRLHLLTLDHTIFYAKLSWTLLELGSVDDHQISIMKHHSQTSLSEEELRFH